MSRWFQWTRLIAAASLIPLLGGTCSTDFRDALYGGMLDFVTDATGEMLANLIALAQPGA
ncbi:MAG: hypothetical protein PVJ57_13045 [Phycisphaerae bacterium]|jgi:hypothetical protein